MKILLLGEYSGVHTNLALTLRRKGYEVFSVHNGDGYKSFVPDYNISYKTISSNNKIIQKIINLYYLILVYSGFKGIIQIFKYLDVLKKLKGYDVVQLINPRFLAGFGTIVNLLVFIYLKKNNKKIFLCALGDDYYWVNYCLKGGFEYSVFDRLNLNTFPKYSYSLHYKYGFLNPFLNKYICNNVNAIIPGLYDYYVPYKEFPYTTEVVPIIVETKVDTKLLDIDDFSNPVKIFHGWQPGREITKGNDIFDIAIKKLLLKYPNKIEYTVIGGVPYHEYKTLFQSCHIFIDQCFSQDCGVNALLGLAEAKVVFSGFEDAVKDIYNIDYNPLVNAKPDPEYIYTAIEDIILNPKKIKEYSKNALRYISDFHSAEYVLEKYKRIWMKY